MNPNQHESRNIVPVERLKRAPRTRHANVAGSATKLDISGLWRDLRSTVEGEVRFDEGTRGLYAQDGSNYYHIPLGVVLPRSTDDVLATIAACRKYGAPITSRTGGTSLAGQACNEAIIIDHSKYLRHILEIDPKSRTARVEPGVICDELTQAAKPHNLTWGPKPATHSRCGFGGMLSNNCGGMNAQYSGIAVHNVEALDVALYDGTRLKLGWLDETGLNEAILKGGRSGEAHKALRDLRDRYRSRIEARYPKIPRRVSGYNLDELIAKADGRFNLARTLVGSEGTCATILEAKIRLVDLRPERVVVVLGFRSIFEAAAAVGQVLAVEPDPMAIEGMDERLRQHIKKKNASSAKHLDLLSGGEGWLIVQIGSDDLAESKSRAEKVVYALRNDILASRILTAKDDQENLWKMREGSLGATAFVPGERDAWEGWEDSAVPPERLADYLRDLDDLYHRYDYQSALYGHFGQGLVHCRVSFDLADQKGIEHFHSFLGEAAELVAVKYGGSLSGEHGDGQSKAEFLEKMFGPEIVRAFGEFRAIWDPDGKMNPGKIVKPHLPIQDLRLGKTYDPAQPKTHFQFPDDNGSFARATLRCVGVGACRELTSEAGTVMCPSFMVTQEERHSTRGRTHLLWEMLRREGPITGGFRAEAVKESLDLCLACKGCKTDCPVNVDVATYKAEFLSHYYEGRVRPRHAYAFGLINQWAKLAAIAPGLVNLVSRTPGLRNVVRAVAGMSQKRAVPQFAAESFRAWFQKRKGYESPHRVVLWVDTFNDHFHPEALQAAVKVLEHFERQVIIPSETVCCGRPLYDFGMLDTAKAYLEKTLSCLEPHIDDALEVIVLEPSCCSVFKDELPALMPGRALAQKLAQQTLTLADYLANHVDLKRLPKMHRKAIVQTHCHHHAVMQFDGEKKILHEMGLDCDILRSGCCGMAGSFGFQADKLEVSQACGERVLLPAVRSAANDTFLLADGFSCKTQIAENGARRALHLAEVIASALEHGEEGPPAVPFAESATLALARAAISRSTRRAALWLSLTFMFVLGAIILALTIRGT